MPRGPSQDQNPTVLGIPLCVCEYPPSIISRQRPHPWVVVWPNCYASVCPKDRERRHGNWRYKWCRCIKPPHPTIHWQPPPKTFLFLKIVTVESLWFLLLNTSTQASPLIYCCVFLLLSYKQDPHSMNKKNPMWGKRPQKRKKIQVSNWSRELSKSHLLFRYTMCNNTFFPCSELWSTPWRISA